MVRWNKGFFQKITGIFHKMLMIYRENNVKIKHSILVILQIVEDQKNYRPLNSSRNAALAKAEHYCAYRERSRQEVRG